MAKIVVECADPNDPKAVEAAIEEMTGKCNITYFRQAEKMKATGKAKSDLDAAKKIAKDTDESEEGVRQRIRRGREEVGQGVQSDLTKTDQVFILNQASEIRREKKRKQERVNNELKQTIKQQPIPADKYQTITIDPPWPVKKIIRDDRPNQDVFDYPTMSIQEITDFDVGQFADDNCHIYLWSTHKFLPEAFLILDSWGFRYQCLLTWVKNVGFTPFSWMYSTEHCLFGRKGSLDLLKKGVRLDFNAKVREHSRKPEEFYHIVRSVSPGPRIDIFSREAREGFDQYGNEQGKFELEDGQEMVGQVSA